MDDFAVASADDDINKAVINAMDKEFKIKIEDLGRLTRYNGVDVDQTRDYIKLHNTTYFNKLMEGHPWVANDTTISNTPIPMNSNK